MLPTGSLWNPFPFIMAACWRCDIQDKRSAESSVAKYKVLVFSCSTLKAKLCLM